MTKTITLVMTLEADPEWSDPDNTYYNFKTVKVEETDLTESECDGLVESLAQSDFGTIGFPYAIMEAIEAPKEVKRFNYRY